MILRGEAAQSVSPFCVKEVKPMRRPVNDMLRRMNGRLSGHMPGHMGSAPFGMDDLYALDTTELPVTDDLYSP